MRFNIEGQIFIVRECHSNSIKVEPEKFSTSIQEVSVLLSTNWSETESSQRESMSDLNISDQANAEPPLLKEFK